MRFARARSGTLHDAVLFESFAGKMVGDNPLGIHDELVRRGTSLEVIWTVARPDLLVPQGARAVMHGSPEWVEAVATSRYLVNNTNFPPYFRKAPGQVYCQTWHGTPLKRLAHDMPVGAMSESFLALYDREAAAWDFLLAANEFSADALGGAFGYHGPILTVGYPRNDPTRHDRYSGASSDPGAARGPRPGREGPAVRAHVAGQPADRPGHLRPGQLPLRPEYRPA